MNIVESGSKFQVYDESIKTYHYLPSNYYNIGFHPMQGFSLIKAPALEINEDKVYGVHTDKINKIFKSYKNVNRNFGIILSGKKGIGKSLFVRELAVKAKEKYDMPVIIVDSYIPGIGNFLSSIQQEAIVVFDEFEKHFRNNKEEGNPQEELLSLFDGLDAGRKLFCVTCNELNQLNEFLIDRPGRFHYHIRLKNPTAEEIKEYLNDKLAEEYKKEINNVINFSYMVDLTYDYLRAIAFELNMGTSFSDAIDDLNIPSSTYNFYKITVNTPVGTFSTYDNINFAHCGSCYTVCFKVPRTLLPSGSLEVVINMKDLIFENKVFSAKIDRIEDGYSYYEDETLQKLSNDTIASFEKEQENLVVTLEKSYEYEVERQKGLNFNNLMGNNNIEYEVTKTSNYASVPFVNF